MGVDFSGVALQSTSGWYVIGSSSLYFQVVPGKHAPAGPT